MIVPINRLLEDSGLAPEEIDRLRQAYGYVLKLLQLVDRNDPIGEIIVKKIIEINATGVRDPVEISKIALRHLTAKCRVLIIEDEYFLANDFRGKEPLTSVGQLFFGIEPRMLGQMIFNGF